PMALRARSRPSTPFLFNATPTPPSYTLSLHDALPICEPMKVRGLGAVFHPAFASGGDFRDYREFLGADASRRQRFNTLLHEEGRSEEHTSELQSRENLVCRLLLEKKKHQQSSHQKYTT